MTGLEPSPAALPNSRITTNTNSSPLETARATQLLRRAGEWKWLHAAAAAEPLQEILRAAVHASGPSGAAS